MRTSAGVLALLLLVGCTHPSRKTTAPAAVDPPRITAGTALNRGQVLHSVRPVYPKELREQRVQGTVFFVAVITKTGEVGEIEVLRGDARLIPYALDAVRQWRFSPCILNAQAIEIRTQLSVPFSIDQ